MGPTKTPDPNRFARQLFAGLPARYDRLAELLSLGQNRRWRREMVDRILMGLAPSSAGPPHDSATAPASSPALAAGSASPSDPTSTSSWAAVGGPTSSDIPSARTAPCRARVLDVASGTAGVAIELARHSGARVVGVDLSEDMLAQGARHIAAATCPQDPHAPRGSPRAHIPRPVPRSLAPGDITLTLGRAEQLPFADRSFDALTFTYLLRYVGDVDATLRELARVVRAGAPVASLDFAVPHSRFWRFWWWGYTRLLLPVAGGLCGGRHWYLVGRFLGPNISGFYQRHPGASLVEKWHAAGFEHVGFKTMSLGGGIVMWGRRAKDPAGAMIEPGP